MDVLAVDESSVASSLTSGQEDGEQGPECEEDDRAARQTGGAGLGSWPTMPTHGASPLGDRSLPGVATAPG